MNARICVEHGIEKSNFRRPHLIMPKEFGGMSHDAWSKFQYIVKSPQSVMTTATNFLSRVHSPRASRPVE